jgi:molybdopterin-guanine dinucleotide biosynthesis protein MobB
VQHLGALGLNPVFGIAGFKNAGKTTLVVEIVRELTARGLRVGTVKHAHHAFDIDHPGKDSYLHREAGAREVIVASARRLAHIRELEDGAEPALDELLARLGPLDLVLVEGYKRGGHPKLEIRRGPQAEPLLALTDASVRAIVSDDPQPGAPVPVLPRGDVPAIADFVLREARR